MAESLRKPLYGREKHAAPAQICVTGATGYIAASIIQRLLAAGHLVHATVRDPIAAPTRAAHLLALPGAEQRLKFFEADLEAPGSFDAAIAGCQYVVHTASPVVLGGTRGRERERIIAPAVAGVENVLASVNRVQSVQRVVLTSSVAAVVGVHSERGAGHAFTEDDWDLSASETFLPYHYSKVMSELRAVEMCEAQSRWSLVRILPGLVQGPPLGNIKCESVGFMRKILNGRFSPIVPPIAFDVVDVDDTAAAHCLALFSPSALGRYICVSGSHTMWHYIRQLRPSQAGRHKLAYGEGPYALFWLIFRLTSPGNLDLLRALSGPPPAFDSRRIRRDLGLTFIDAKQSALDMVARLEEQGVVRPRGAGRR